jgi:hypothetical protein
LSPRGSVWQGHILFDGADVQESVLGHVQVSYGRVSHEASPLAFKDVVIHQIIGELQRQVLVEMALPHQRAIVLKVSVGHIGIIKADILDVPLTGEGVPVNDYGRVGLALHEVVDHDLTGLSVSEEMRREVLV